MKSVANSNTAQRGLLPSYRRPSILRAIFKVILTKAKTYQLSYLFGVGDMARARLYKALYSGLGLQVTIHLNSPVPLQSDHEDVQMYLLSAKL